MSRIESRSSKRFENDYEFLIECSSQAIGLNIVLEKLKEQSQYMQVISRDSDRDDESVPWFPRKLKDLDRFANHILSYGSELDADHPVITSLPNKQLNYIKTLYLIRDLKIKSTEKDESILQNWHFSTRSNVVLLI